jgi:hypothetical protein
VRLVDLATGVCTPVQVPDLLRRRSDLAAERLPDGRIVCAGGHGDPSGVVYGPPVPGAQDAAWSWSQLPAMSVGAPGCRGCVMSDGCFAVLSGWRHCEVLATSDANEHWDPLLPMHCYRGQMAHAAVARCIIVAGGDSCKSAEVYDEVLGRWLMLPHDLPNGWLHCMGSALL